MSRDMLHNPVTGVILPKQINMPVKTKKITSLSKEEFKQLLSTASLIKKNGDPIYQYAPAIVFMLNIGLRSGELLALTWDKIDYNKRLAYINVSASTVINRDENSITKTKRIISDAKTLNGVRYIPLNTQAIKALECIAEYNEKYHIKSQFVVCTRLGEIVTHRSFQSCLDRLIIKSGLNHIGTHSLRHSFASILLQSEGNIKIVSDLLVHGNTSITYNTYIHMDNRDKLNAVETLTNI